MNCFEKTKKEHTIFNDIIFPVVFFATIVLFFFSGLNSVAKTTSIEQFKATKVAVTRAVIHCYAIEGAYPPSLDYLEKQYGLSINHDKYFVDYNCFASNLMPDITVLEILNQE